MKLVKFISVSLAVAILLSLFSVSYASTLVQNPEEYSSCNEYDYIVSLQEASPQKLMSSGLTQQTANSIVSQFEAALTQRAALPEDQLKGLGYNDEEIAILRAYLNGASLSDSQLRAITGTCTGSFNCTSFTSRAATFSYTWEWDHCPVMTFSDSAALRWFAYDVNSNEIGVIQKSVTTRVNYYFKPIGSVGTLAYSVPATLEPNLDLNTVNAQFPVAGTKVGESGIISECYAHSGTTTVSIELAKGTSSNLHHISVAGLYGHTTLGIGSPSVSVGKDSLAISFTGNVGIDPVGDRKATINNDKSISYWS